MTDQASNIDLLATLGVPGAGRTRAVLKPIETILSDAPRAVRDHFLAATKEALRLDATPAKPRRQRTPRRPTLASVAKQANKAALDVGRYEVKPDGTIVVVTGQPEHAEPENAWPLDEFRTKETKQ
ncbi:MAG TPA: hypothetical protein VM910_15810 [Bradyrhizobium sp.]|nr:hypothetical protein [Bradyrhizobium sp.]